MLLKYRSALWEMVLYEALALVESAAACAWTCFLLRVSASYACKRMRTHWAYVNEIHILRFEVLRAVLLQVQIFRKVSPCRLVNSDRRFEGSLCLRTQSISRNIPEDLNLQKRKSYDSFFFREWNFLVLVTSLNVTYLFLPHKFTAITNHLSDRRLNNQIVFMAGIYLFFCKVHIYRSVSPFLFHKRIFS